MKGQSRKIRFISFLMVVAMMSALILSVPAFAQDLPIEADITDEDGVPTGIPEENSPEEVPEGDSENAEEAQLFSDDTSAESETVKVMLPMWQEIEIPVSTKVNLQDITYEGNRRITYSPWIKTDAEGNNVIIFEGYPNLDIIGIPVM